MYLFKNLRFPYAWTVTTISLTVLLLYNSLVYFQSSIVPGFLLEKGYIANNRIWATAFYFHVASACLIMVPGTLLFFTSLLKYRRLHFLLGYLYMNGVLWVAAPTGLVLAPFSKGGWPAALGFGVTGVAWWWATWAGYRAIRQGRVTDHIHWMVRSWCLALSAVTFRVMHIGFAIVGLQPLTNYVLSIWFSLVVNAWFAEWFISRSDRFRPSLTEASPNSTIVSSS